MKFTFAFATVIVAAGFAFADYAGLYREVNTIQQSAATLSSKLSATSGTSYVDALNIDRLTKLLNQDIKDADTQASTATVTGAQAQNILNVLTKTYTTVDAISKRLVALQPSWKKLGVAGIAKSDIALLADSVKTFGATLVARAPAAYKKRAQTLSDNYNAALSTALAAYN